MTIETYQNVMSYVLAPLHIGAKLGCAVPAVFAAWQGNYAHALAYVLAYWLLSDFILPTLGIIVKFMLAQSLGKDLQLAQAAPPVQQPTYLN